MTAVVIPLNPVPSQTLNVTINNQYCTINVYAKWTGMYFDLYVDNLPIVTTKITRNELPLVNSSYNGFVGDFYFIDTQGKDDPLYTGLGTRWLLVYG